MAENQEYDPVTGWSDKALRELAEDFDRQADAVWEELVALEPYEKRLYAQALYAARDAIRTLRWRYRDFQES